jgi:hypothetical protein
MAQQLQVRGFLLPNAGCADGCAGAAPSSCPWELTLRNCVETFQQARQADFPVVTVPNEYVELFALGTFTQVEFLAVKTSGPLTLRLNGEPAKVSTTNLWPTVDLTGQTLLFTVDGVAVSVLFGAGDDTQAEVIARINAAAVFAGASWLVASLVSSQVQISGKKTGAQGSLSAFTGTAAADLGLDVVAARVGTGADVPVDGLWLTQFGRNPYAVRRVEVSGVGTMSVLAAGV